MSKKPAPVVLFLAPTEPVLWERLTALGYDCRDMQEAPEDQVFAALPQAFGIVIRSRFNIDRKFLDAATQLVFVARSGVGVEHIDLDYAAQRNITVFTSPEGSRDAVGEHTIGLLLMLMNHLARADRQVRRGEWIRGGNRGHEIKGKTVGIIGYGNMGQAFARRLQGFSCKVIAYDKFKTDYGDEYASAVSLEELKEQAHILSLHIPYLPENHHLVDAAYLAGFQHPIWLVNTARGLVVKTDDLVQALDDGRVSGAALDVIEYEDQSFVHLDPKLQPAAFHRLLELPNVVLNPHIAGWSYEAEEGHAQTLTDKIEKTYGQQ
ncbi:NAD(P)-dependent oxidoreductase [Lewinella cohaerens]|uniref:NAD(P)-dependent oxidoreductase n=1 Tax=Lewinella cohaerens TaxID=70995 RepID=UPI0003779339|nr:NAD(P)-dependent oxidoreductase [Lewinella cohaerens]